LASTPRPPLVWLEFQDCAGCSEAFLRATNPSLEKVALEILSVNYHETIMAPSGKAAEKSLWDTVEQSPGQYLVVVEGAIPSKEDGIYCTIGGRTALDIVSEVCKKAAATITVGACAFYGGWPSAAPNPTGAMGVRDAVPGIPIVNLPGCPPNAANISATIVHYLTFGTLPATDQFGRPLFAYGARIHDSCERRGHFDAGQIVEEWGDERHRSGWCPYEMGCKGPATYHNCPSVRYNEGASWPVGAGHGCVGCSEPGFWDTMSPFYRRLPDVPGFGVETTADKIGLGIVGVVAAAFGTHAVISAVRARKHPLARHDREAEAGAPLPLEETQPSTQEEESHG
jgi:hydrogenase small subunit